MPTWKREDASKNDDGMALQERERMDPELHPSSFIIHPGSSSHLIRHERPAPTMHTFENGHPIPVCMKDGTKLILGIVAGIALMLIGVALLIWFDMSLWMFLAMNAVGTALIILPIASIDGDWFAPVGHPLVRVGGGQEEPSLLEAQGRSTRRGLDHRRGRPRRRDDDDGPCRRVPEGRRAGDRRHRHEEDRGIRRDRRCRTEIRHGLRETRRRNRQLEDPDGELP